jgi:hypothetical protein
MSIPVYGFANDLVGYVSLCSQSPLTPDKLTEYINRADAIVAELALNHDKDTAISRLDIIRQEIAVLTNTPFRLLEKSITLSNK